MNSHLDPPRGPAPAALTVDIRLTGRDRGHLDALAALAGVEDADVVRAAVWRLLDTWERRSAPGPGSPTQAGLARAVRALVRRG